MNCDDFLPAMETGGPIRRLQARRHRARCPRCAAAYVAFERAKTALARHPPVTAEARAVWSDAMMRPRSVSSRSPRMQLIMAGVATTAAAVVVVCVLVLSGRGRQPHPRGVDRAMSFADSAEAVTVTAHDPGEEFTLLALAVEKLSHEIDALEARVQRRGARNETAVLLHQYDRW